MAAEADVSIRVEDTSGSKFRKPYSAKEERVVIDYLLAKGGFNRVGGNELWKEMEQEGVCKGRSWQSLKARYVKAISGRLEEFGTSRLALENADMNLQKMKKKKQNQETTFMDNREGAASDSEGGETSQKETLTNNFESEHSSEVDTQKLIDTIFGDEQELDIEVAELEDETNPSVAAEIHVEHNEEGEPSELDLLTIEMNSNKQTNPSITDEPKRSQEEKDEFDVDSDSGSDTLMDRIIAKSKRGGSGGQRGKRRKEAGTEEEAGLSIKEKLKMDKKRKAETQEVEDGQEEKRMRVS